jgi:hypothetical protein
MGEMMENAKKAPSAGWDLFQNDFCFSGALY